MIKKSIEVFWVILAISLAVIFSTAFHKVFGAEERYEHKRKQQQPVLDR